MTGKDAKAIDKYFRLANYISAAQIYLRDNFLIERPLISEDIKPRLLGHWGTCPGINFVYAHLNYLIKKTNSSVLFVLGPGHGFPALQANLYLEGTLRKFYEQARLDEDGLNYICKNFSWPYGFPSHSNPGAPGVILEGGELGYSLSTSFGAALDNSDLIVACLIGDGEAETGPLAASWQLNKFLNPEKDGAVLPILHLNGYKISGPAIFGRMSKRELKDYFKGCGWSPIFVKPAEKIFLNKTNYFGHREMAKALQKSYLKIKKIKSEFISGKQKIKPDWPMIILETPKGWTGIKELGGKKIEGNCLSHQVPAKNAKENEKELKAAEKWLQSYRPREIFHKKYGPIREVVSILPPEEKRMGRIRHAFGGKIREELDFPDWRDFTEEPQKPGEIGSSSARRVGEYLKKIFEANEKNFRLFSPDETYSNKLDAVFQKTKRTFLWPLKPWDEDLGREGKVVEILSEHSLQGMMEGYILTGRHGVFATYEAFVEIVSSMADQYAKFLKAGREFSWRKGVSSFNYFLTSSGWRQDHNGFSHQNPSFIGGLLEGENDFVSAYFPPDAVSTLAVTDYCLKTKDKINIICAGKTLEPRWLNVEEAEKELEAGIMIWDFAGAKNPDIVFAGIGDYMTKECLAAIYLLKKELPNIKARFVSILEINNDGFGNREFHEKNPRFSFDYYFTKNKPVIFNFHGYPEIVRNILFKAEQNPKRFQINGYIENGSTTTPYDMQIRNKTSRWHLLTQAAEFLAKGKKISLAKAENLIEKYENKIKQHNKYIIQHGVDLPEIEEWRWE